MWHCIIGGDAKLVEEQDMLAKTSSEDHIDEPLVSDGQEHSSGEGFVSQDVCPPSADPSATKPGSILITVPGNHRSLHVASYLQIRRNWMSRLNKEMQKKLIPH